MSEPVVSESTVVKIEEGKFYRTRDGRRVGPMIPFREKFYGVGGDGYMWTNSGNEYGHKRHLDLISEWVDPDPIPLKPTYRVGDEIEVRLKITDVVGRHPVFRVPGLSHGVIFEPADIIRHIPAPRPIAVGDRVEHKRGRTGIVGSLPFKGYVLVDTIGGDPVPWSTSDITRIDPEQSA